MTVTHLRADARVGSVPVTSMAYIFGWKWETMMWLTAEVVVEGVC